MESLVPAELKELSPGQAKLTMVCLKVQCFPQDVKRKKYEPFHELEEELDMSVSCE